MSRDEYLGEIALLNNPDTSKSNAALYDVAVGSKQRPW